MSPAAESVSTIPDNLKYDYAIFIGRFQPFHIPHSKALKNGLARARKVVVVLGSHRSAPNIRNSWDAEIREKMIMLSVGSEASRVIVTQCRDHKYLDNLWVTEVQQKVHQVVNNDFEEEYPDKTESPRVCLIGNHKDYTSNYLDMFPQWSFEGDYYKDDVSATDIRNSYFSGNDKWKDLVAPPVADYLEKMKDTQLYSHLSAEYQWVQEYDGTKYPLQHMTVDGVIVQSGHVLVVRRRLMPGKGQIALPGGFVQSHETAENAVLREIKEETRIQVQKKDLRSRIVDTHFFDEPNRSVRGRTFTLAYLIRLPDSSSLPRVKGDDDAERAFWLPLGELFMREDEFFEDHLHIISMFVNRF